MKKSGELFRNDKGFTDLEDSSTNTIGFLDGGDTGFVAEC